MKNLVTTIIISFKSHKIIENSIKNIGTKAPIIVIENSKDKNLKKKLETKYNNVKVLLNNNNGFGQAANFGVKKAKTKYVLFCSPDTMLKPGALKTFVNVAKKNANNFGLLIPSENKRSKKIFLIKEPKGAPIVFVEKKKFLKMKGYDENFFLYFESTDACINLRKNNKKIYVIENLKFHHFGTESSDPKYSVDITISRNWHFCWSKFYLLKKHYGYFYGIRKTVPNFVRALKMCLICILKKDKKNFKIHKASLSGLISSYFLKKSDYRPLEDKEKN